MGQLTFLEEQVADALTNLDVPFALPYAQEGETKNDMPDENIVEGTPIPKPEIGKQGDVEWALYYNGHSDEDIRAWFEETFHYPPDEIRTTGGGKLAGPLRAVKVKTVLVFEGEELELKWLELDED